MSSCYRNLVVAIETCIRGLAVNAFMLASERAVVLSGERIFHPIGSNSIFPEDSLCSSTSPWLELTRRFSCLNHYPNWSGSL
jgi:hypothetical protein